MTDAIDNKLLYEVLKQIQADVAELKQARQEMREGFASIKSHITGLIGDVFSHERRMLNIEDEILRLKNRLSDEDHQH
jgi:septal ring factor EnvC (AmiA/AmiB activator)